MQSQPSHQTALEQIRVGTAGWCVPVEVAKRFPGSGTHLERYSKRLPCAEINSSFYRPHRRETYAKWASQTPAEFRFAVKIPKVITHELRLRSAREPLQVFLQQVRGLGPKLGPLLVQLPPSLDFEPRVAARFFGMLRELHDAAVVCEPRHLGWFDTRGDRLLARFRIGRVAADPAIVEIAGQPGGWTGAQEGASTVYFRLHGAPRVYWSNYRTERLAAWAAELVRIAPSSPAWCIFDNTASGAAIKNAMEVMQIVQHPRQVC